MGGSQYASSAAVVVVVLAALVLLIIVGRLSLDVHPRGNNYPDLIVQSASSCWETTVFAITNDPFHKWVTSASVPSSLVTDVESNRVFAGVNENEAASAYQKLSVWRIWNFLGDNKGQKGHGELYNSPDPHVMGGVLPSPGGSLWKMDVNWGISLRYCLGFETTAASCRTTAPLVVFNTSSPPKLGYLMRKVPYRMPNSIEPSPYGHYLTNFISSARFIANLKHEKSLDKGNTSWYYRVQDIGPCSKTLPVNYYPDVISYMLPFYQCGCLKNNDSNVCLIGYNLTGQAPELTVKGFRFDVPCDSSSSFWDWNAPENILAFISSNQKPRFVHFDSLFYDGVNNDNKTLYNVRDDVIFVMTKMTKCLQDTPENCGRFCNSMCNITSNKTSYWWRYLGEAHFRNAIRSIPKQVEESSLGCQTTTQPQQDEDQDTCFFELGSGDSGDDRDPVAKDIPEALDELQVSEVAHVHQFALLRWQQDSSKRTQVYVNLVAAGIALLGTFAGVMSGKLLQWGDKVLNLMYVPKRATRIRALLRTFLRGGLVFVSVMGILAGVYISMDDVKSEKSIATSETILHEDILVTTTSTVEVSTKWNIFADFCAVSLLAVLVLCIFVYYMVLKHETMMYNSMSKETETH